jgi:leader peptidase (prepilin peptidase) / N-methyltransferase
MFSLQTLLLPNLVLYLMAFGFGVIIGSFLNVYIYRFHTGKSLSGSSHCLSCGTKLQWFELFPLFSYLSLRGNCRTCGCKIPARYFLVELTSALLFMLTLTLTSDVLTILFYWGIFSILLIITVYDLYHFIIPDELTVALTLVILVLFGYEYYLGILSLEAIITMCLAALGGGAFFLFLWLVSRGAWLGFGDVKLAFPLGLLVGATKVFSFVVLAFWIGAAISLLIIGFMKLRRGKEHLHLEGRALTMKSAIPFAPFLVASSLVILFTQFDVLQLFSFI